ncbi:hypothetical protein ILYODFUR_034365 [Ilyodon furcidens]|uniref:Ig-like domain-containing protein n=1 Tax=Ilyodon furcidens TaxID=33524 RepID=A0ABV0U0J6_9TELE
MVSDSVRPEDSVTLQCSVLSDFENKTCSGDLSVFWFRSDRSHPGIIYTNGNKDDGCEKRSDSQKKCVFSKNVSSSDTGTYYCAVATCGEILFGNRAKLVNKGYSLLSLDARKVILLLSVVLAINLMVIAVLMWSIKKNSCVHCGAVTELQKHISGQKTQQRYKGEQIYSAAIFTATNSDCAGLKKEAEKRRYIAAKAFELN